jgi:hypothetical protein
MGKRHPDFPRCDDRKTTSPPRVDLTECHISEQRLLGAGCVLIGPITIDRNSARGQRSRDARPA